MGRKLAFTPSTSGKSRFSNGNIVKAGPSVDPSQTRFSQIPRPLRCSSFALIQIRFWHIERTESHLGTWRREGVERKMG